MPAVERSDDEHTSSSDYDSDEVRMIVPELRNTKRHCVAGLQQQHPSPIDNDRPCFPTTQEAAMGLAPGTVAAAESLAEDVAADEREPIYDIEALHEKLEDIGWSESAPWEATQVITADQPTVVADVEDDLQRELAFYQQVC